MSLLSSFLVSHIVPALESALIAHAPEMQDALLKEIEAFTKQVGDWISSKKMPEKSE